MANKETKENEEEKIDVNSKEVVVERLEHGLIGSLRIEDNINKPKFKKNDIVNFKYPSKIDKKDYVLYKDHDEYYIRRIMKYSDEGIYVAGDNEKNYHLTKKENIIGRAITRQRKNKVLSLNLNTKNKTKIYDFFKFNLSYFRLKKRVVGYESDLFDEAYNQAIESLEKTVDSPINQTLQEDVEKELDSILNSFINPDDLVIEMQKELEEERIFEENKKIEKERKLAEAKRMVENYELNDDIES